MITIRDQDLRDPVIINYEKNFVSRILTWYKKHGRKDLPWQQNPTPYRVWISEIMLQQTQVKTVILYYQRFIKIFPNLKALATSNIDTVLHLWSGLGYYARARNLHASAKIIQQNHAGRFPRTIEDLQQLPGIGRSTAGAILSFSMNTRAPILDGNVKRVFIRFHAIKNSKKTNELWELVEIYLPQKNIAQYNQALMDIGSLICTRTKPKCCNCPLQKHCQALKQNLTDVLPIKQKQKTSPIKKTYLLIIMNNKQEILLEQRAPVGIWGGLWCFPACDNPNNIETDLQKKYGLKIQSKKLLPAFRHTFSHFRLDITPIVLTTQFISTQIMENKPIIWHNPHTPFKYGLPQPITKLLKYFEKEVIT